MRSRLRRATNSARATFNASCLVLKLPSLTAASTILSSSFTFVTTGRIYPDAKRGVKPAAHDHKEEEIERDVEPLAAFHPTLT